MSTAAIVLRPEPGNAQSCDRLRQAGLEALAVPLFRIVPREWDLPDALPEAVLFTSANAVRVAGPKLARLAALPCFAVGRTTADAAREHGFCRIESAERDATAAVWLARTQGVGNLLHLAGAEFTPFDPHGLSIERRIVYAAEPVDAVAALSDAAARASIILVHSRRAGARLKELAHRAGLSACVFDLAAISQQAALGAGEGWRRIAIAASPNDQALVAEAARLARAPAGEAA